MVLLLQIIQQVTKIETGADIDEINKFVPSEIILNEYFAMSGIDLTFISEKLPYQCQHLKTGTLMMIPARQS